MFGHDDESCDRADDWRDNKRNDEADFLEGWLARLQGKPYDPIQSADWQDGWDLALREDMENEH